MKHKRWKSIMVDIADPFAREQPALAKAAAVSLASGARLVVFNSFMLPQPVADVPMDSQPQIIKSAIRQRRERLQSLVAGLGVRDATCIVAWDYPVHEAVVRRVLLSKPDLLLIGSHRHGRLARWLLANTDWELMRACPCPVWFVRSAELPERPSLLVAVDPFHSHEKPARLDDRLIQGATQIAQLCKGRVGLVHAVDVRADMQPVRSMVFTRAKQAVTDLGAAHVVSPEYCDVTPGRPADVIGSAVRRESADILVMGVVSRSFDDRPVIGNTAERVIDHVDCDVLVIKPSGFKVPEQGSAVALATRATKKSINAPRRARRANDKRMESPPAN